MTQHSVIIYAVAATVISLLIAILIVVLMIQRRRQRAILLLSLTEEEATHHRQKKKKTGLRRRQIDFICPEALVARISDSVTTPTLHSQQHHPHQYHTALTTLRAANLIAHPPSPTLDTPADGRTHHIHSSEPEPELEPTDQDSNPQENHTTSTQTQTQTQIVTPTEAGTEVVVEVAMEVATEAVTDAITPPPLVAASLPTNIPAVVEGVYESPSTCHELPLHVAILPTTHQTCVICLDAVELAQRVRVLPCSHIYHSQCIRQWLRRNNSCPSCAEKVLKRISRKQGIAVPNTPASRQPSHIPFPIVDSPSSSMRSQITTSSHRLDDDGEDGRTVESLTLSNTSRTHRVQSRPLHRSAHSNKPPFPSLRFPPSPPAADFCNEASMQFSNSETSSRVGDLPTQAHLLFSGDQSGLQNDAMLSASTSVADLSDVVFSEYPDVNPFAPAPCLHEQSNDRVQSQQALTSINVSALPPLPPSPLSSSASSCSTAV